MQGFTYTELAQALQDWPENTDDIDNGYVDNIPRAVQLAELRVVKDLNLDIFDILDETTALNAGNPLVIKPAELIVTRSMWLVTGGVKTPILQRSRDFIINYSLDPAVLLRGAPKYYAEENDVSWRVAKIPAVNATIATIGIYRPASIFDEESTWLGDHCGDLLFRAALMESEDFIKADDRYADQEKMYQTLLGTARLELRSLIRSGDYAPYRAAAKEVE